MTADMTTSIKASRMRVPRSRGAFSGFLLVILGAWAALIPFIGPAFNVAYTPMADSTWHWTSERGWLEVLPGAVAFLGGLLLLRSTSRLVTSLGAWLGAAAGAWLLVGPTLAPVINVNHEIPDPRHGEKLQALDSLLLFYGIGALILFIAAVGLGRVSVQSVRDVRAAERRAAEAAAEEERLAEERRIADERRLAEERRGDGVRTDQRDGFFGEKGPHDRVVAGAGAGAAAGAAAGRHGEPAGVDQQGIEQQGPNQSGFGGQHASGQPDQQTRRLPQTEAGPQGDPTQHGGQYPPPPPADGQQNQYPPVEPTRR
ncbi:MAG TPA: hypothetical protein VGN18_07445 [Jatrophihabitans sp.]|jgi:hypothetical protein|uniref:hypothetical protein n=1 Tax=Jatrophihabitans sp. TaxID=1932789 RepID=UPI002DFC3E6B|nr:hypothetical protein [Jatrophihabitans sp.]